jgi:hypothetical protein
VYCDFTVRAGTAKEIKEMNEEMQKLVRAYSTVKKHDTQ